MDRRDLDTPVPVPDELDLAAQEQDAPEGAPELECLLTGRFFTIGVGGAVSAWSARAQDTFGFTNAAVVGQGFVATVLAAGERLARGEEIEALLRNEGPPVALHIETRALNAAGIEFQERFAIVPIRLLDGYELNGLLQDLAKFRRADDRPRLEKAHARILSVLGAELTGRVIEDPENEDGWDEGEEAERLVGALVIFEGEAAPPIAPEGVDEETGEPHTSEDELVAARHQIDKLRFEVDQAQRAAANALRDAELAREEVEQTRARLNDVRGSADDEHERAQQLEQEAVELRAAAEAAEGALEEARSRAGEAESELEGVRAELAEATRRAEELESLRGELADAVQRRDELEGELGEVQSAFGEAQAALGEVQGELDAAHATGSEQGEALRRELEEARAARDEATSKLAEMEGELSELTSRREELASELDAKRTELAEVASRRDDLAGRLDSTGADLAEVAAKRGELAEELEEKRQELAEVAGRRDELASALDSKEHELEAATSARDELAAAVEVKETELEAARASESEQAEALRAELEQARSDLEQARSDVDEARSDVDEARSAADEARSERDVLAEAVEALTSEVSDLTTKVHELTEERDRLTDELGRREQELAEARAAAEDAKGEADRRQARVDELAEALQEAQQRSERAQAEAERAAGELETAHASAEEARLQAKGAIGELDEARRQVDLFRGAFDTAPIGMALTATDGRFVKVNRTLCGQLGYKEEQLLSDDPPSIVHPDDVEANREMARRLLAGEIETSRAERRYVHADGHEIHMRESVALVRGADGAPLLFIFQLEDATEAIELGAPDEAFTLGSASGGLPVPVGAEADAPAVPATATVEGPYLPAERVRQALEEDQFVLYCQPVLDLRSNVIAQYELLIRMVGEDGRLILPQAFLKPAEQAGLVRSIDHWVVRRAVRLIAENARAGRDVRIEVNVSPESLVDRELVQVLDQELAATPISPSNLVVEVTESAAVANPEGASALAKGVRGLGARFALDDFGSTFGSFRHLKDLPLDYLKIDGDLVSSLTESRTSQLVVKALVDVARGTGTETIAVFVSDDETLSLLRQHGVGFAQGYVVGRPQPLSEVFADGRAALPPAG